jgi:hypothetical protein
MKLGILASFRLLRHEAYAGGDYETEIAKAISN